MLGQKRSPPNRRIMNLDVPSAPVCHGVPYMVLNKELCSASDACMPGRSPALRAASICSSSRAVCTAKYVGLIFHSLQRIGKCDVPTIHDRGALPACWRWCTLWRWTRAESSDPPHWARQLCEPGGPEFALRPSAFSPSASKPTREVIA
jgi:hypothetical protein